jgi:hypothetical protein
MVFGSSSAKVADTNLSLFVASKSAKLEKPMIAQGA